jgi:hypothetical protein
MGDHTETIEIGEDSVDKVTLRDVDGIDLTGDASETFLVGLGASG